MTLVPLLSGLRDNPMCVRKPSASSLIWEGAGKEVPHMIGDLIGEWIKGILIDGIMGNLSGLFNTVNTKVGEIASDVGSTPQDWNGGIFSMLQNLSETVIVPIAAAILALVMCYELIDMIVEKNNMHDFDSSMFFRWIFKSAFAILIVRTHGISSWRV